MKYFLWYEEGCDMYEYQAELAAFDSLEEALKYAQQRKEKAPLGECCYRVIAGEEVATEAAK